MERLTDIQFWEIASYIVTVVGLPFAIVVYWLDQKKERQNEEEELYQRLSDEYADFSRLLLENADLRLSSVQNHDENFTQEQLERKHIIFDLLVSLFERAYILVYEENMTKQTQRLWATWEDYIRFWCRRSDFLAMLPELLDGEDPEFVAYIDRIANQVKTKGLKTRT